MCIVQYSNKIRTMVIFPNLTVAEKLENSQSIENYVFFQLLLNNTQRRESTLHTEIVPKLDFHSMLKPNLDSLFDFSINFTFDKREIIRSKCIGVWKIWSLELMINSYLSLENEQQWRQGFNHKAKTTQQNEP